MYQQRKTTGEQPYKTKHKRGEPTPTPDWLKQRVSTRDILLGTEIQHDPPSQIKRTVLIAVALYLIYAAGHFIMGAHYGCQLNTSFLFLFPVKQIYTIPSIDRAFSESFSEDHNPNNLSSATLKRTQFIGTGVATMIKGLLSIEHCSMWSSFGELLGASPVKSSPTLKPTVVRPAATPTLAKKRAELVPSSAWLHIIPKTSGKKIAICHQPDIRFIHGRTSNFYKARCGGKWGWVEAEHIKILGAHEAWTAPAYRGN